jgi:hypothetical protein
MAQAIGKERLGAAALAGDDVKPAATMRTLAILNKSMELIA